MPIKKLLLKTAHPVFMLTMSRKILLVALILWLGLSDSWSQTHYILRLQPGQSLEKLSQWSPIYFDKIERKTRYTPVMFKNRVAIRAVADQSASGWIWQGRVNLSTTPYLNWCWAVENTYQKAQAGTRSGDDYPARIYANFAYEPQQVGLLTRLKYDTYRRLYGVYPPLSVLNYIWSSQLPQGQFVRSAYADNVMLLALRQKEPYKTWRCEKRHLIEDHLRYFGKPPTTLTGVAFMTDADNTGEKATAYYGNIWFSAD